jgi:RNA polymerase sigma-70 factor (ECF subfamily)
MLARLTAADDVAADAESREREREVRRAVRTLPARYREALVLFYFCEMDLAAAASRLGVPEGTLKARLHRGRAMLRQRLHVVGPRGVVVEAL